MEDFFTNYLGQNKLKIITTTPQIKDVKVVCFDINRASSFIYLLIDLLFGRGRRGEEEEGRGEGGERGRRGEGGGGGGVFCSTDSVCSCDCYLFKF